MKKTCLLAVAVAALTLTASPSQARSTFSVRSLSDSHIGSSKAELVAQKNYSSAIVRRLTHTWRFAPRHRTCWTSTVPWHRTCNVVRLKVQAHRWLYRVAAVRLARLYPTIVWPPHHALWMCIHGDPSYRHARGGEAGSWDNQNTGHNGHWGGLQMHPGWGYGTSYHASDDSQYVQEWAAERGYAASGHSSRWLSGQWGETISPCWGYAS